MSTRTYRARSTRAHTANELMKADDAALEAVPRRAVVSALGVLIGTGVITLAFGSAEANAKSALDELPWLPPQLQAPRAPSTLPAPQLSQMTQATNQATNQATATTAYIVPAPNVARAQPVLARPVATEQQGLYEADIQRIDPVVRAPAIDDGSRTGNMQADLQSSRSSIVAGSAASTSSEPAGARTQGQARPARVQAAIDSRADVQARIDQPSVLASSTANPGSRKQNGARSKDASFSDWLDDGSGSRARFNDAPVPEQAIRAALRGAADAAAARSATLRQAKNDWEAAQADVDQVKGQRWPQVQLGGNTPSITGDSASFNQYNKPTANIAVTTMVYDWGKTSKSIDSRTKTAQAAEFYYRAMAQQNAYEIASNLIELSKNRASYAIGESYVKRMEQLVNMLVEIVKADPGRLSELTQAKARLLQAQTSQETVAAQVHSLQLAVRKLIGDEPVPMPSGTHWRFALDGLDDAVAAVAQNPAIEQAAAEAAAAKLTAQSVRAEGLPRLNWVINKTTAADVFGNRQPWSTMLQLSWTPFQGGSQRAAERAALSRASSSSDKHDQLELDSEYKVRDAHRDAIALATRAKLYAELSTETDLVRKQFFEQWYHLNRRTLLDVLSAESDFYNNQIGEVTTEFDSYQSILKIHLNNGTLTEWLGKV